MIFPDAIIVDNHMGCNASCRMCPLSGASRTRGTMSERHFSMIEEQVADFYAHLETVYLGLHGEPLLDPGLEDKIRRMNRLGSPKCVIHSNASLMGEERARSLLEAGVAKLIVSLESLDPAVYEPIRRGLNHGRTLGNIERLIALRDSLGSRTAIQVRFIVQRENWAEREVYEQYWHERIRAGLDEVMSLPVHNYLEPLPGIEDYGSTPCGMFLNCLVVLNDGTYPLCCLDYEKTYTFGSIEDTSLLEAFNSSAMASLRELHRQGRRGMMKTCSHCIYPELEGPSAIGERYIERFIRHPQGG